MQTLNNVVLEDDNKLAIVKNREDYKIKVLYRPLKIFSNQSDTTSSFNNFFYFIVEISINNNDIESAAAKDGSFSQRIKEMSSGMNEFIYGIADDKERIAIEDYVFPRMYGSVPKTSFMVAFDRKKVESSKILEVVVNHPEIGILFEKFAFEVEELINADK